MSHPRTTTRGITPALHRGPKLETGPSKNNTGIPKTPSGLPPVAPAKNDTETNGWNNSTAAQQDSDENAQPNSRW
jgi:hypothetical protein